MRIRQIALVARDLDPALEDLSAVLGVEVAFNDPAVDIFGLKNGLLAIGDTFLEVVSPVAENTTAGRFLERRGGDGGYMVIVQSDDLAADRKRLEELGVRVVWEIELPDIATIHLHPRDVGGAILSLDAPLPPESWRWAGPDWQSKVCTDVSKEIAAVEIQAADPAATADHWARILARASVKTGNGACEIALDRGIIRFIEDRDGRGDGVSAIEIAAADGGRAIEAARERGLPVDDDEVRVCGIRIRFS